MFGKESVIDTTANKANRNKAIIIPKGDGKLFKKQNVLIVITRLILKNIYIVITILILNTIDFLTK